MEKSYPGQDGYPLFQTTPDERTFIPFFMNSSEPFARENAVGSRKELKADGEVRI